MTKTRSSPFNLLTEDSNEAEPSLPDSIFVEYPMDLLRENNYGIEANISGHDGLAVTLYTFLDTGTGPNLVNDAWLPHYFM